MKKQKLSIVGLRAKNVLGLKLLELDSLGRLTEITGPNGSGKSSALKALALAFGGARKDSGLLHRGTEEGEVWVLLSDGTEVTRRITPEGAAGAVVKDGRFKQPVKQPEKHLSGLLDALSLDPVRFLEEKPAEQIARLLEAFPVQAEAGEITPLLPRHTKLEARPLSLPELDALIVRLREERTAANGAKTKAKKTLEQLADSLPPEGSDSPDEELLTVRAAHEELLADQAEKLQARRDEAAAKILEEERAKDHAIDELRKDTERRIANLRLAVSHAVEELSRERDEAFEAIRAEMAPVLRASSEKIGRLEAEAKGRAGALAQREFYSKLEVEAKKLEGEWAELERSVKGLEGLKTSLLSKLPIEGVTIDNGKLAVKDEHGTWVLFGALNTAAQIKFAVRLAAKRAEEMELPAILCDGLERLDPKAREAFLLEAEKTGCQFLVTFATDESGLEVKGSAT